VQALTWRKNSYSEEAGNGTDCVEVAELSGGLVGVRDSKNPDAGHLTFTRTALAALLRTIARDAN
jgi:Domain of unknown function (DUF397)